MAIGSDAVLDPVVQLYSAPNTANRDLKACVVPRLGFRELWRLDGVFGYICLAFLLFDFSRNYIQN